MQLLNKTPLVALRHNSEGEFNENYEWVDSNPDEVPFKCSLQPLSKNSEVKILPEGVTSSDAFVVLTKTEILEDNEHTKQKADEVEIRGRRYKAFKVFPWTGFGLSTDHYRCIFIKKDLE